MAEIVTKPCIMEDGKVIVPPGMFERIHPIPFDNNVVSDKLFSASNGNGGELILISDEYADGYLRYKGIYQIGSIKQNCMVVAILDESNEAKWALLNPNTLEEICPYVYDEITPIVEDLYLTRKSDFYGVIDSSGNEILSNVFNNIVFDKQKQTFIAKK